ncbi:MAG: hypothetical protein KC548_02995 [Nanoarchaeota archaeon]|nr:hypothetical protein [Nanoarchaeota archaeon]
MKEKNREKQGGEKKNSLIKEEKLKGLRPSLRQKKRFILVKVHCQTPFSFKELSEHINEQLLLYIGTIKKRKSGLWIIREQFEEARQEIIIRVSCTFKDKAIAALTLVSQINRKSVNLEVLKVSSTLKGLRQKNLP